jgi:hypothetical protein
MRTRIGLTVTAALVAVAALALQPSKTGLGKEIRLFNGKDLSGWTHYLSEPSARMTDVWSVDAAEKTIICKGNPVGYIRTVKDYADFVLKLEWRFSPVTRQPGNSGVLLRIVGPDKVWPKCIEAQLMSGNAGDFWLIDEAMLTTAPERVDAGTPRHRLRSRTNERPVGEWNAYDITCNGGKVWLKVNGELLNEGTDADIAAGKIGLQSEGVEIHFRNIRLTPILRKAR